MSHVDRWVTLFAVSAFALSAVAGYRSVERLRDRAAQHAQTVAGLSQLQRRMSADNRTQRASLERVHKLGPLNPFDLPTWTRTAKSVERASSAAESGWTVAWDTTATQVTSVGERWSLHTVPWRIDVVAPHGPAAFEHLATFESAVGAVRLTHCTFSRTPSGVRMQCDGLKHGLESMS